MSRDPGQMLDPLLDAGAHERLSLAHGWEWRVSALRAGGLMEVMAHIQSLESHPSCRTVRDSMVRWVGWCETEAGPVVVKRFRPRGIHRILLMNARGPQWRAEWDAAHALRKLGVHTPAPLAMGERVWAGLGVEGATITAGVLGAISLGDALAPGGEGKETSRRQIMDAIGPFLLGLHEAGVFHRDLHGDNVLVCERTPGSAWVLLDLHRLRHGRRVSERERLWNLAQVLNSLAGRLSAEEEETVLRGYVAGRSGSSLGWVSRETRRMRERMTRRHERSRSRRCLAESTLFKIRRVGSMKVFARREFPEDSLPDILRESREVAGKENPRALKLTSRVRVTVQDTDSEGAIRPLCVKEYLADGVVRAFRWSLLPSRARRFWRGWWGFKVRGLGVPEAYLMWEDRRGGILRNCGVVMEWVADGKGLDRYAAIHFAPPLGPARFAEKRGLIRELAATLARMHRKGVFHGDLKAGNVLVRAGGISPRVVFLDLDGVRFGRRVGSNDRALNLAQLDCSMPACVSRWDRLRFLRNYGKGSLSRADLKEMARRTARISEKRRGGHR
jgi:tRNA A-37 threonylcarbamoyl transferase component Bud32